MVGCCGEREVCVGVCVFEVGGWVYRVMWRDLLYPGFVFFLYVGVGFRGGWVFGVDGVGDGGFM